MKGLYLFQLFQEAFITPNINILNGHMLPADILPVTVPHIFAKPWLQTFLYVVSFHTYVFVILKVFVMVVASVSFILLEAF
jgi:polyferredoxin